MKRMVTICLLGLLMIGFGACAGEKAVKPAGKTLKPTPKIEKKEIPHNWIIHNNIKSKYLDLGHNIIVYLPKDYDQSKKTYPVLYAHDGQNLFNTATAFGGNEWMMDENIEALQKDGLLEDIIVVGIYNNAMRMYEYTPTKISNEYVNNQGGLLREYAKFIVEELKPFIDKTYRTKPDRLNTGVMGSSLGGIASLYIIAYYPDVFSKAGCISPSFWWDNNRVVNDLDGFEFPDDVKIYIDGGWKEGADESSMVLYMRGVYKKLIEKGLNNLDNILYYEDPVGAHSEYFWAKRGKAPLLYLFGKFQADTDNIAIQLLPDEIGKGDRSAFFAEITYKNGCKSTVFGEGFSVDNETVVEILEDNAHILGKSGGKANLVFTDGETEYKKSLTVYPDSRDNISIVFEVVSPTDVAKMNLLIVKENRKPVSVTLPIQMLDKRKGVVTVKKNRGDNIAFQIQDGGGKKAYYEAGGKVLENFSVFNKSKTNEVVIGAWQ